MSAVDQISTKVLDGFECGMGSDVAEEGGIGDAKFAQREVMLVMNDAAAAAVAGDLVHHGKKKG